MNNKKYKLIKEYPGSFMVNTIITNERGFIDAIKPQNYPEYWEEIKEIPQLCVPLGTKFKITYSDIIYTIDSIQENRVLIKWEKPSIFGRSNTLHNISDVNKFFNEKSWIKYKEPVVKDYEILSLISHTPSKTIITYENGGGVYKSDEFKEVYNGNKETFLTCFLNSGSWNIHSIKRLSDGEIFTVGDDCEFGKLTGFVLNGNSIMTQTVSCKWSSCLQFLKKVKQPLFKTEDGVDIYEGDRYYYMNKNTLNKVYNLQAIYNSVKDDGFIFFSTE